MVIDTVLFLWILTILYGTQQFSKCLHIHSLRLDEPRQNCTHMPLLWLSLFAKCKVLLLSAWLLTLGSWPSGSSIIWEGLRKSGSLHLPRPPYQNLSLNSTLRWCSCHWSLKNTDFLYQYIVSFSSSSVPSPPSLTTPPLLFPSVTFPQLLVKGTIYGHGSDMWEQEAHLVLYICTFFYLTSSCSCTVV